MSFLTKNGGFLPIKLSTKNDVSSEERSTAIDFVNRHNLIFEEFNVDDMLSTFLPDSVVYHIHSIIRGHVELRDFLQNHYEIYIHGVRRSATNHVVDRDEDGGVMVRYHESLIRYGWPGNETKFAGHDVAKDDGLPAIWFSVPMMDRLRMTDDGWKIYERYLVAPSSNRNLDPPKAS